MSEHPNYIEIETGADDWLWALTFSANGEHLISGGRSSIQVWRVKDGGRIATMKIEVTRSIAVSKDGRFIAAGSNNGDVFLWDATNYEQVFAEKIGWAIWDLDFSPDSTKLVSANGKNNTVTIWDMTTRKRVRTLQHDGLVGAAKYSPQGDRIATATLTAIQVWDSDDERLLVDVNVEVKPWHGLLWSSNHLFVKTKDSIKQIDASTGLTISQWSVSYADYSCIALPQHAKFLAYATKKDITFWDSLGHTQVGLISQSSDGCPIAFSPDSRLLAIESRQKIIIKDLVLINDLDIHIEDVVLNAWKRDQLIGAETMLTAAIQIFTDTTHHILASRALVRARLRLWDAALVDAEESIKVQSSVVGYIAKFVVLVGRGEMQKGCRICDIAFQRHSDHVSLLLLIKAVVLFMAGAHVDGLSRIDDLIPATFYHPSLCIVQGYMYFFLGNMHMESGDYEHAIRLFEDARAGLGNHTLLPLSIISLITGWKFDGLAITIQQRSCEALFSAGRIKKAGKYVLRMINQGTIEPTNSWVSEFIERCLSTQSSATVDHSNVSDHVTQLYRRWARSRLTTGSWDEALVAAASFMLPRSTIYQVICEYLEAIGRVADAVACFHEMRSELGYEIDNEPDWTRDFKWQCHAKLGDIADIAVSAREYDQAISHYTIALSLNPITPQHLLAKRSRACARRGMWEDAFSDMNKVIRLDPCSLLQMQLLREWANENVITGLWKDALAAASCFMLPRFTLYKVICEHLEMTGHEMDAVACFHQMYRELGQETDNEQANWARRFKSRCSQKLENLADSCLKAMKYDDAISGYTSALSLNPATPQGLLIKRSTAHASICAWEDALSDANKVIELDPSSPSGYQRKHAALHGIGRHDDATQAFETMLLKMSESSDPEIRKRSRHYVRPEKTKQTIRRAIEDIIRDSPPVLIDTRSGRLCDKLEQASTFERTPTFTELVSSTTTHIDDTRIKQEVGEYYRYATFSHKWENNEPLFEQVIRTVVYDLEASPTHEKLQMFCKIVRQAGFNWAWSDTCCINKGDNFVLQEALVSMFKWYEHSSMTIIYLLGVGRLAKRGALTRSIWNMRAWTLQEYHASKVVRIYTEGWTPYLGLTIDNHKNCPEIISEMEEATGISAQALMALRPGLDDIRDKLRLASTRQTTRVEDAAYSLFGIFSISLPITYGEGDGALGRLLAQVLTSSGDTSTLAWTGTSGSFNSCLPTNITVFSQLPTSHIPPVIPDTEMERVTNVLWYSVDFTFVTRLYDQVNRLLVPSFSGRRMRLPCLTFKLGRVSVSQNGVFYAKTDALGIVEIKTQEDLSQLGSLTLIHPWIDFLLDRQPVGSTIPQTTTEDNTNDMPLGESPSFLDPFTARQTRTARLMSRIRLPFGSRTTLDVGSLCPPSIVSPVEEWTRALRFIARLQRPFGALLLTPTRRNVEEYKRVAAECLITVQVAEVTPEILDKLTRDARMLDVL